MSFHTNSYCCTVVPGCERVLEPLTCDLTAALSDREETYHLRVSARHDSAESYSSLDDFYPSRDTELQTPVLRVALCNSSLCVDVDTPVPQLRSVYDEFWYQLKVVNGEQQQATRKIRSLGRHLFPDVTEGSEYCVSIRFADPEVDRKSSFGPAQCISVHDNSLTPTVLPLVVVLAVILVLLGIVVLVYVQRMKPTLPTVLTSVLHSEEQLVSCHPTVSSLLFIDPPLGTGQTESCSSDTDSSDEDEEGPAAGTRTTDLLEYRSKASLCSATSAAVCRSAEGPEEVDLLTLTFSRDSDSSTALLPEITVPLGVVEEEELDEDEDDSEEDGFQTGYISRQI